MTAGVVVGSLIPGQVVETVSISDKVLHAGAYFVLMVCFAGFYARDSYPVIAVVLVALGLGLDVLQLLTETRAFDWYDVAANGAGVAAGVALSWLQLGGWCQRLEQRLLS